MPVSLSLVGDIMLGDHPVRFGHGVRSVSERTGISRLFAAAASSLTSADLVIGNLEGVLADAGLRAGDLRSGELRGRPADARGLRAAGFQILSVANNHAMQHGRPAFEETIAVLRAVGIEPVGIASGDGMSNVVTKRAGGEDVAIIAYSLRPERYVAASECRYALGTPDRIAGQVRELRQQFATVVLCLHWGDEYLSAPSPEQIRLGRALVDCGVAVIAGHHPHVLQGLQRYAHGLILFSLGNFISDKWRVVEREAVVARVSVAEGVVGAVEVTPFLAGADFALREVTGRQREARDSKWRALCRDAERPAWADDETYARAAAREYLRYRIASYWYFASHAYRYSPRVLLASLARSARRRFGGS